MLCKHRANMPLWMALCIHSEMTSLTRLVNPENCPIRAAVSSMHILTQNDQLSCVMLCNHSNILRVLQLLCWLAIKVHIAYPHVNLHEIYIKQRQALLPLLVDLSTCFAYHSDSLILSKNLQCPLLFHQFVWYGIS